MPETVSHPYIEFREVSKAFGENAVLDRVSFDVMPGEPFCILGRSGVGKSVSLQILMGFLKADSGTVIVAGQDITNFSENQLGGHPKESHHGFSERSAFRLTHRGRERGVSAARKQGTVGGADLPDRRWPAADGGRKGNARPFALGSLRPG